MLQTCAFAFDVSYFEIWGALANGGRLVLYPETRIDTHELTAIIGRYGVNTLWLTSGLFDAWVAQLTDEDEITAKYILVGGDVVSPHSVRRIYELSDEVQLINGYGPTENTVFSACHVISREEGHGPSIPIGRPVNQTQAYVLDSYARQVPIGVHGELYVGGVGVARGYKNREDLNAQRFIDNPFSADRADRLYRTGDLVRFLPGGCLQFLGRLDGQVKVRGFRIETGEIVAHLLSQRSVVDALVMVDGQSNDKRLIAYVIPARGVPDDVPGYVHALRRQLRQTLPEFMIPSAFGVLESFPMSPNGKVDRALLPAIDLATQSQTAFVEPESPTELALAAIWSRILNLAAISTAASFFEVGGNSLNLTRVQAEVRKSYGLNVPLKALFASNTIRQQAELIDGYRLLVEEPVATTGAGQVEEVL
jgi:acyl-coenzyme A synthetase/AMP-(fatty) acid ligase